MTHDADLSAELAEARRRLAELEAAEAGRRQGEHVQRALYRIAELASAAQDMQEFYRAVHSLVGELMYANNFFIALYDEERQLINWPYWDDGDFVVCIDDKPNTSRTPCEHTREGVDERAGPSAPDAGFASRSHDLLVLRRPLSSPWRR